MKLRKRRGCWTIDVMVDGSWESVGCIVGVGPKLMAHQEAYRFLNRTHSPYRYYTVMPVYRNGVVV